MKWSFEQKLAWAKSYMAGEFVPVPTGFPGTLKGWHDRVKRWVNVLLEYGEEGLNPFRHNRSFPPEFNDKGNENFTILGNLIFTTFGYPSLNRSSFPFIL